jgi:hypothetical protein
VPAPTEAAESFESQIHLMFVGRNDFDPKRFDERSQFGDAAVALGDDEGLKQGSLRHANGRRSQELVA